VGNGDLKGNLDDAIVGGRPEVLPLEALDIAMTQRIHAELGSFVLTVKDRYRKRL